MPIPYVKCRAYGVHGIYYIEHLKFEVDPWMTYFFTAQDYTFDTIRRITSKDTLLKYLEAYFRHNLLYGEDKVTNRIEEVIDDYLQEYLDSVPSTSFRIHDKRELLYFKDIKFHPQDYPRSILAHPSISDYYYTVKDELRDELKEKFIVEEWEKYVDKVVDAFIDVLKNLINEKKKVIWEVPHTIYKSKEPFSDDDIRTGKVKPYIELDKYEHEFFDYEVGFDERIYYKLVEHLPSGSYSLNFNWERSNFIRGKRLNIKDSIEYKDVRKPKQIFYDDLPSLPPEWDETKDPMIEHEGLLCEYYMPFPVIGTTPWCRGGPHTDRVKKYEGRFINPMSWGGFRLGCPPWENPPPPKHLIHQIRHIYSKSTEYRRGEYLRTTASRYAGSLWYELEGSMDERDYEPPKELYTDEWYTEEHFGEYPSLEYDQQKEWWKEYREVEPNTVTGWHTFWQDKMTKSKEDLVWYINTHIDRENRI